MSGQKKIRGLWFYVVAGTIVALVWGIQIVKIPMNTPPPPPTTALGEPSGWDKSGVQVFSDTVGLLTGLGTALLGALGLLMGRGDHHKLRHEWLAFLCAMSAGVSLFFGYVCHLHLLYLVEYGIFDATIPFMVVPNQCQFYSLLLGAFFLAIFAVLDLSEEA